MVLVRVVGTPTTRPNGTGAAVVGPVIVTPSGVVRTSMPPVDCDATPPRLVVTVTLTTYRPMRCGVKKYVSWSNAVSLTTVASGSATGRPSSVTDHG